MSSVVTASALESMLSSLKEKVKISYRTVK